MTSGIYKITNHLNGKSYIGQSIDIETRWLVHKKIAKTQGKDCSYIHKAISKYGLENFQFEILLISEDSDELNEKEQEFISNLESLVPKGYNLNPGGGIPWNRGKTKATSEKIANISLERKEKYKQGLIAKRIPWNKGKKLSDSHKEALKGKRPNANPWNKGLTKEDPRVESYAKKCGETKRINPKPVWNKGLDKTDPRVERSCRLAREGKRK